MIVHFVVLICYSFILCRQNFSQVHIFSVSKPGKYHILEIYFHDWIIYSKFCLFYFCDGQIWEVTEEEIVIK